MKRIGPFLELNVYVCAFLAAYSAVREDRSLTGKEKTVVSLFALIPAYVPFYTLRHLLPARCPDCGTRSLDHARPYHPPVPVQEQTRWCRLCNRSFRGPPDEGETRGLSVTDSSFVKSPVAPADSDTKPSFIPEGNPPHRSVPGETPRGSPD